ncbi:MAG: hypothetical protein QG574_3039 [Cyanobacteriota bacterium erpe_2018_sw_21hr_WHONDRS-SW48-000092_B_bin.40]|jgi:hypothetical protein|nr:hypothetical protein [Cyanobacteriota bacterium erpe_2018_sw_21hr_WHONDRS-SW48-000092_B_bin.40]
MRDKFRLFLLIHERSAFRAMAIAVCLFGGIAIYLEIRDPVEEFLSGRSSRLDGYGVGPVMIGLK